MKSIKLLLVLLIASLLALQAAESALAYTVPAEYRTSPYMKDPEVWIVSEQHIDQKWAQGNLRDMGQTYTNHGLSGYTHVNDFVKQRGMAELRTVMTRHANRLGLTIPLLEYGV